MSYVNVPLTWPFKMVPATPTPGIHFDDDWAHKQIKPWERKIPYFQKWVKSETTKLQIEAGLTPNALKVYDQNWNLLKSFAWTAVVTHPNYKIYETTFDVSDLANQVIFLYQDVDDTSIRFISEPIHINTQWKNTLSFIYRNSSNKNGMAWATGISMRFRCEAAIHEYSPDRERNSYVNQPLDVKTLHAVPTRVFKLLIADGIGCPPYIVDILNRIFCCDYVEIGGRQIETAAGSKWEKNQQKGYPWIGASIDIVYAKNLQVIQQNTGAEGTGMVINYDLETDFFSGQVITEVIEVLENQ